MTDHSGITPSALPPPLDLSDRARLFDPMRAQMAAEAAAGGQETGRYLAAGLRGFADWRAQEAARRTELEAELFWARERREEREAERTRAILAGELVPEQRPGTWEGHLMWLLTVFGDREFTTPAVRDAALAGWTAPPAFAAREGHWRHGTGRRDHDPAAPGFALRLGQAYAPVAAAGPVKGWLELRPGGVTHNRRRWHAFAKVPFPPL